MAQTGWENFCREHDDQQGNCLELALRPAMDTYPFGSGVLNSEGSEGCEATSEVKMVLGSVHDHGCSPRSSAASLSLGNGLVDHKDDNLYVTNHVELEGMRLNSVSEKTAAAGIDHQTDPYVNIGQLQYNYSSLASEDEMIGTWSPHEAGKDAALILNRSGTAHFQSSDAEIGESSARLDVVGNYLSRGGFPVAQREMSWVRSAASKSRRTLFSNEENLQEWPKLGTSVSSSAKDSTAETQLNHHGVGGSRNNVPRVCVDCKTTKTPLWRSGPQGPKSLCNACGIRYRKARRALSAFGNNDHIAAEACNSTSPKRKLADNREERAEKFNVHFKKRSKLSIPSLQKFSGSPIHLETNSSHSAFQRVFAQDEEEAAVLLMALSCGLVHV